MALPGVLTHCPYCALQCGMSLRDAGGRLQVEVRDFPTNRGGLCQKGWTSAELLASPDRLTTPLVRAHRAAPLKPASWDEALARVAAEIRRVQAAHGPDSVAVFGGGGRDEGFRCRSRSALSAVRSRRSGCHPAGGQQCG